MATINKQWLLASRPAAEATVGNFRLVETPVPALAEGQVLVRHQFALLVEYRALGEGHSGAAVQQLSMRGQPAQAGAQEAGLHLDGHHAG